MAYRDQFLTIWDLPSTKTAPASGSAKKSAAVEADAAPRTQKPLKEMFYSIWDGRRVTASR